MLWLELELLSLELLELFVATLLELDCELSLELDCELSLDELLELFVSRPGHLFPREEIVESVWHQRYLPTSRTLDVHVRRLRAKLEQIEAEATLQTIRGVGYRLTNSTKGGD